MLTDTEYNTLALSILESEDSLLNLLDVEQKLLPDNPKVWKQLSQVLSDLKDWGLLSKFQLNRIESVQKTIKAFEKSTWDRDERIPADLFRIEHIFFYFQENDEPVDKPMGKIHVYLCCDHTVKIMDGLRSLRPSKEEYAFFKSTFFKHKTANEYLTRAIENDSTILGQVFRRAKTLRPVLDDYYLTQIRSDIIYQLDDKADKIIDFQLDFDKRMEARKSPESFPEVSLTDTPKRKEFTTARQVLAMHYLFEYCQVRNIDQSNKARFIEFLTGKNYKNIYDAVCNPLARKNKDFRKSDLQYIRTYFENLGLFEIVKAIGNELDKPE